MEELQTTRNYEWSGIGLYSQLWILVIWLLRTNGWISI
jgi:hypothetical protein